MLIERPKGLVGHTGATAEYGALVLEPLSDLNNQLKNYCRGSISREMTLGICWTPVTTHLGKPGFVEKGKAVSDGYSPLSNTDII
jgi:hypothetical protein